MEKQQQDIGQAVWTPQFQTLLTKFIQDLFQNQPPSFLPVLKAEEIQVDRRLILRDTVQLTNQPNFRKVGETGQPAFANSWANYGAGWGDAAFWKDPFGWVHLRGLIKTGTVPSAVFTLPPGFRPGVNELFAVVSNGTLGRVDAQTDGQIVVQSPSSNVWLTLSGIHFRTS